MESIKCIYSLLIKTGKSWNEDTIAVWSAALSYYTVFSLAPLLLLVVSIAGFFLGQDTVKNQVMEQLVGILGRNATVFIAGTLNNSTNNTSNITSTIISIAVLIFGATGVFGQIKQTFNAIWGVQTKKSNGVLGIIRERVLSFSMLVVIGFLLMISLVASAVIQLLQTFFAEFLPFHSLIIESINFILSFIIIALLFGLLYKVLPDVKLAWRHAFAGGLFTSLLFTIGKTILGIYIGSSGVSSTYGAAASLVVILLWVYYSSQILFLGAEFTKFYSLRSEKKIIPNKYSEIENEEMVSSEKTEISPPTHIHPYAILGLGVIYTISIIKEIQKRKKEWLSLYNN